MKRSERLVDTVKYLLARPHTLIALPFFADRYGAAKSSISEDLAILRQTLANDQNGILETVAGAAGGVRYIPFVGKKKLLTIFMIWLTVSKILIVFYPVILFTYLIF